MGISTGFKGSFRPIGIRADFRQVGCASVVRSFSEDVRFVKSACA